MNYKIFDLVGYGERLYERARDYISLPNNEHELAVAGVSGSILNEGYSPKALDYVVLNGVERFFEERGNVTVIRSRDKKTISLHPGSVRHDSEGYVRKVLADHGVRHGSATIKRIAGLVDKVRGK